MIILKNKSEIEVMKTAGKITVSALYKAKEYIKPGITTKELDKIIEDYIRSKGAVPSFKGYGGFPASACISVNNQVIHGIPSSSTILHDGDIVSIDVGAKYKNYHGDCARTYAVGNVSEEASKLIEVTRNSFYKGIEFAKIGYRLGDLGFAIDEYVKEFGYTTVKNYVGHGVGADLHEDPSIPNFGKKGRGQRFVKGMTIAVEPMINQGSEDVKVLPDKWTVETVDGKLSAHYENSLVITDGDPIILTSI